MSATDIKEVVKEKYGQAALRLTTGRQFLLRRKRDDRVR
jgi:hypothetical protein